MNKVNKNMDMNDKFLKSPNMPSQNLILCIINLSSMCELSHQKDGDVVYGRPLVQENIVKNCLVVCNHFWLAQQTTFQITSRRQNSKLLV